MCTTDNDHHQRDSWANELSQKNSTNWNTKQKEDSLVFLSNNLPKLTSVPHAKGKEGGGGPQG